MRILYFLLLICSCLSACGVPGWGGSYASDVVDELLGAKVTHTAFDNNSESGELTIKSKKWTTQKSFYLMEKEDHGYRYHINFGRALHDRCHYSLFVDGHGIIRSWRDEGGSVHMTKCYAG